MGKIGYNYDVSALRYNSPYLLPAFHKDLNLTLYHILEDGISENAGIPLKLSEIVTNLPGIKVFNFHPMNIYINGHNSEARLNFLKENPDLLNTSAKVADNFRHDGPEPTIL